MPGLIHLRMFENNISKHAAMADYLIIAIGVVGFLLGTNDAVSVPFLAVFFHRSCRLPLVLNI